MAEKTGNLRFTDSELLPWIYRLKFLDYTEQVAPEVLESLKALCPKWETVIAGYAFDGDLIDWLNGSVTVDDPIVADTFRREMLDTHLAVKQRYRISDSANLSEAEEIAWKNAVDLRECFTGFLEKYGLTTDWLRQGLFRTIRELARNPGYVSTLCHANTHAWFPAHGEEINLQIDGWKIEESWQQFEDRARTEFERRLSKHKSETIKKFRDNGYKKTTKPLDYTSVKWLVMWTVKRMSKDKILAAIDFENAHAGKIIDLKTLEHHFRNLRRYDLPVRKG